MKRHYPVHIQLFMLLMLAMLASCTSSRRVTSQQRQEHAILVSHLPKERQKIIDEAETWIGTPYLYAGQDKGVGTDCSGMVMQVYLAALEYPIPRNSARQAEFCQRIESNEVVPGDLVFFATGSDPKKVSHVGIIVDESSFIHASSSKGVIHTPLSNPWWAKRLIMYGRLPVFSNQQLGARD